MASEQRFIATVIQRYSEGDGHLFWFSTKVTPPQVCFLVSSGIGGIKKRLAGFETELNGQHNFRTAADVELVEVSPTHLRVRYMKGVGVTPGHVDAAQRGTVRDVEVTFHLGAQDYLRLLLLLAPVAALGVSLTCAPWKRGRGKLTRVREVPPS